MCQGVGIFRNFYQGRRDWRKPFFFFSFSLAGQKLTGAHSDILHLLYLPCPMFACTLLPPSLPNPDIPPE